MTMHRRNFLLSTIAAASVEAKPAQGQSPAATVRIGHRQADMPRKTPVELFDVASRIPGLDGVELQVFAKDQNLWDHGTVREFKREAARRNLAIPSIAGIWPQGRSLILPEGREEALRNSIQVAEFLGAKVILVVALGAKCPDMTLESSYQPAVEALRKCAPAAADAGVTLALETSLDIANSRKLIDLVNDPSVRLYWDLDNVERFGFHGQAVAGITTLGARYIAQVHCKNEDKLLRDPGRVDWSAAFSALKTIGYHGWLVFETRHSGVEQCIEATRRNIAFIRETLG